MDYASPDTVEKGLKLIQEQIKEIPRERTRQIVQERLMRSRKETEISGSDTDSEVLYGMNQTPGAERVHIGFFGKRNAGKSSVMNKVTGQDLAVVSEVKRHYHRSGV